jgi:hypothetical protein
VVRENTVSDDAVGDDGVEYNRVRDTGVRDGRNSADTGLDGLGQSTAGTVEQGG